MLMWLMNIDFAGGDASAAPVVETLTWRVGTSRPNAGTIKT